jgi:hypothetical protein
MAQQISLAHLPAQLTLAMVLIDGRQCPRDREAAARIEVRGEPGDLLHFHNLRADGIGDRATLHAGMPVIAGEKWLLSQWLRTQPYPARTAW